MHWGPNLCSLWGYWLKLGDYDPFGFVKASLVAAFEVMLVTISMFHLNDGICMARRVCCISSFMGNSMLLLFEQALCMPV